MFTASLPVLERSAEVTVIWCRTIFLGLRVLIGVIIPLWVDLYFIFAVGTWQIFFWDFFYFVVRATLKWLVITQIKGPIFYHPFLSVFILDLIWWWLCRLLKLEPKAPVLFMILLLRTCSSRKRKSHGKVVCRLLML